MSVESNKVSTNTGSPEGSSEKTTSGKGSSGAARGTTEARACAACKYQRRRCAPNCPLAPYFPAENQQQFLNAHRLFGLRNLCKVLKNMKPPHRDIAIKSMIFQANTRASDPVGGCYRIVQELRKQIDLCKAQLDLLLPPIATCRAQILGGEIQKFDDTGTANAKFDETSGTANVTFDDTSANVSNGGGNSCLGDTLNIYNHMHVLSGFDYDGHHHVLDDIPHQSEDIKPLIDGSFSERMAVSKVGDEADQTQ